MAEPFSNDHEKFDALTEDYLDGSLTASDKLWFEAHLPSCGECREKFEALKYMLSETAELDEEPPEGFDEFIMTRIELEKTRKKSARLLYFRPLIGAAACFVLISVGALIIKGGGAKSADSAANEAAMDLDIDMDSGYSAKDTKSLSPFMYDTAEDDSEECSEEIALPDEGLIAYISENISQKFSGFIFADSDADFENANSFEDIDGMKVYTYDRDTALKMLKNGEFGKNAYSVENSEFFDKNSDIIIVAVR